MQETILKNGRQYRSHPVSVKPVKSRTSTNVRILVRPVPSSRTHTGERVAQGERDAYQRHLIVFS